MVFMVNTINDIFDRKHATEYFTLYSLVLENITYLKF